MDGTLLLFFDVLVICVILIGITLITLPQLGDERKNLIKLKAQSYAFTVVVGFMLIETGRNIYRTTWGSEPYEGINPFIFLNVISVIYLSALLFTKGKYS